MLRKKIQRDAQPPIDAAVEKMRADVADVVEEAIGNALSDAAILQRYNDLLARHTALQDAYGIVWADSSPSSRRRANGVYYRGVSILSSDGPPNNLGGR